MHREPRVLQGLNAIQSLLLVEHEQFSDQVLAGLTDRFKFDVVEVEVRLLNLPEHLGRVRSLKRQITAHQRVKQDSE